MIEPYQEAAVEAAHLNAAETEAVHLNAVQMEADDSNDAQGEAGSSNAMMATSSTQTEVPLTREFGAQANPIQDEYARLGVVLRFTYASFLSMEKQHRLLNSHIERPPMTTAIHSQTMAKIDAYFVDNLNEIDPAIIQYLTEIRSNLASLVRFDRIRVSLMTLEIEHKVVEYEQKRLRECELPNRSDQKKAVCNVCLVEIAPGQRLTFGECGHLTCKSCTMKILNDPMLPSRCGVCRDNISLTKCVTAKFKFNLRKEPVCRQCYKPFNIDSPSVKLIRCGHVYHEKCMHDRCMLCGFENINEGSNIPLFMRWN